MQSAEPSVSLEMPHQSVISQVVKVVKLLTFTEVDIFPKQVQAE